MSSRLQNKIAIITGGAAGIGEACVRRFAAEGAKVLIGDINRVRGESLATELKPSAVYHHVDVSDEPSFAAAIAEAVQLWGQLDILVNNAGVALPAKPVQTTTSEEFDRLIGVNLKSVFFGSRLAYPHLQKTRGCILNISSMAGITGQNDHAVYGATKGGINALTKCMAADWGKERIRVNALCPTGVWTETLREWMKEQAAPEAIEGYLKRIHSLDYCPEPDEVASVAAFLCSDDARFVTGCLMPVSGGSECGYKL